MVITDVAVALCKKLGAVAMAFTVVVVLRKIRKPREGPLPEEVSDDERARNPRARSARLGLC